MKTLVIIRTCKRDDFISFLAYKSFKIHLDCDIVFFAEEGHDYKWIKKTDAEIVYRPYCDNFGGRSNVITFIEELKHINTEGYDYVIVSDADIHLDKNPLVGFEFGGIRDENNKRHFSGQLLIYSRDLFDLVLHYKRYAEIFEIFIDTNQSIADDTIMSFIATSYTDNVYDFSGKGYWRHEKLHNLEQFFREYEYVHAE